MLIELEILEARSLRWKTAPFLFDLVTYDLRVSDLGLQVICDLPGCLRLRAELQAAEDEDRAELALRVLLLHDLEVVLGLLLQALVVLRILQHDATEYLVCLSG